MCRRKKKRFDQFGQKKEITDRLSALVANWAPDFASESPEATVHAEELRLMLSDARTILSKVSLPRRDEQTLSLLAENILFEIGVLEAAKVALPPEERPTVEIRRTEFFEAPTSSESRIDEAVRKISEAALSWSRER